MKALKFPLLFLIAFLLGADEFLLGPILTPIGNDLGGAPERITYFILAYALPQALLAPIFGMASDRIGRHAVLLPATAVFGLASVLTGVVDTFELGLVTRALTGIASAGMLPIAFALAADESEGSANGIAFVMGGLTTGIVVSPGLGALVADLWSWRAAFVLLGLIALAAAVLLYLAPRSTRNGTSAANTEHAKLFVPGATGALSAMFFGLGGAVGIYSLVGERLRDAAGLDTIKVGAVYALFGVLSIAGNALAHRAIAAVGDGRRTIRLCLWLIGICIGLVFALPAPSIVATCAALALWALLGGIGAPALQSHIAGLSAARRGMLMALGSSALSLGVAFSAALAGEAYLRGAAWVAGLGAILLAIAVIALSKPRTEAATAQGAA